jgi:hypothetical protein
MQSFYVLLQVAYIIKKWVLKAKWEPVTTAGSNITLQMNVMFAMNERQSQAL